MGDPATDHDTLRELFRDHGLSFTVQRQTIYSVLRERHDHPTADDIYEVVLDRLPGVSRTTVYRSLESFVDRGLARRVGHPGSSTRYDPKTHMHHHFVCEDCDAVIDVEPASVLGVDRPRIRGRGLTVHDVSVQFTGRCGDCRH